MKIIENLPCSYIANRDFIGTDQLREGGKEPVTLIFAESIHVSVESHIRFTRCNIENAKIDSSN